MYLEAMQQIYSNVTKVMVDSRQGSNLLYLPLDKIMQSVAQPSSAPDTAAVAGAAVPTGGVPALPSPSSNDARARDFSRTRDRESR